MKKFYLSAQALIRKCLEIKRDENVLILYHTPYRDYANIIHEESIKRAPRTFQLHIPENLEKLDIVDQISPFMKSMDVIIALTNKSISFWNARILANQNGARIICLPNISRPAFEQLGKTNFKRIYHLSQKISDILSISKIADVTSANGTHLRIPITTHQAHAETGLTNKPGQYSLLPAGEACIMPELDECEGELVVDSGMEYTQDDPDKLVVQIKGGRAVRITGGVSAKKLRQKLTRLGPNSRNIFEFGIGTNETAGNTGNPIEDQKVLGNVHISLGDYAASRDLNTPLQHIHGVVYKATVQVRGKKIIDNGKLMLEV